MGTNKSKSKLNPISNRHPNERVQQVRGFDSIKVNLRELKINWATMGHRWDVGIIEAGVQKN